MTRAEVMEMAHYCAGQAYEYATPSPDVAVQWAKVTDSLVALHAEMRISEEKEHMLKFYDRGGNKDE